jgi:hypothetical protein
MLAIDEHKPMARDGNKEERIHAALAPRYENKQVWHYQGGNCEILEGELVLQNPPHDDVKDCLASVIEICVSPSLELFGNKRGRSQQYVNTRFGGIG